MLLENSTTAVGPLGYDVSQMTDKQIRTLEELEQYDLSFVEERLKSHQLLEEDIVPKAIEGFKRYIGLAMLGHKHVSVPNKAVDEVWHTFLLYTKEYADFCKQLCGYFIHHCPENSVYATSSETSDSLTSELYFRYFGRSVSHYNQQVGDCNSGDSICQSDNACRVNA